MSHQDGTNQPGHGGGRDALILSLFCGVLLWPVVGAAELYKWTDEQGNLHITDIPPAGSPKKSTPPSAKSSRSAPSQNPTGKPGGSGEYRTRVAPGFDAVTSASTIEELLPELMLDGLNPHRATLVSPWKTFEGLESQVKAPVHSWKDAQGREYFTDILPVKKDVATVVETSTKVPKKLRASVKPDR